MKKIGSVLGIWGAIGCSALWGGQTGQGECGAGDDGSCGACRSYRSKQGNCSCKSCRGKRGSSGGLKRLENFCSQWDYEGSILYNQRYFYRGYERCKRCLQTEHVFYLPIGEHKFYLDTFLSVPVQAKPEGGPLSLDFSETRTQFGLRYLLTDSWIVDVNAKYIHYWRDDQDGYDTRDEIWEFGAGVLCDYFDSFKPSLFIYYDIRCRAFTVEGQGRYCLDLARWGIPLLKVAAHANGGYVRAKRFFTDRLDNIKKIGGMPPEIRNLTNEKNRYAYVGGGLELIFCPNDHMESAIGLNYNINSNNKRVSDGNLANYLTNHKSLTWLNARFTVSF